MYMMYIWLAIICIGLVVEFIDAGTLVSVWVSVGAVIPLLMSLAEINTVWYITLQVVVFAVVTVLCIVFIRRLCKKFLFKNTTEKTNLDVWIGKTVKIKSVEKDIMLVKINDIEYRAVLENEEVLEKGAEVEIVKFSGNKIIVKKV